MTRRRPDDAESVITGDGFFDRWSSRKRESKQDLSVMDVEPVEIPEEEDYPTDADMPPIESLSEESDFSQFLSPNVSEQLQQLALRKLFRAPSFNLRDGLDDYDDDFTSFAALGQILTADLRHRLEVEASKRAEAMLEADSPESGAKEQVVAGANSQLADTPDTIEPEASPAPDEAEDQA